MAILTKNPSTNVYHSTKGIQLMPFDFTRNRDWSLFTETVTKDYFEHMEKFKRKHSIKDMSAVERYNAQLEHSRKFVSVVRKHYSECSVKGTLENPDQVIVKNMWSKMLKEELRAQFVERHFKLSEQQTFIVRVIKLCPIEMLADKVVLQVNNRNMVSDEIEVISLADMGVSYVSSKIFHPELHDNIIIMDQDQHNYLRLCAPERIISVVDINEIISASKQAGF